MTFVGHRILSHPRGTVVAHEGTALNSLGTTSGNARSTDHDPLMPYHQGINSSHIGLPEPDLWLSLLIAVIGLGLIAWSFRDKWWKKGRDKPPEHHT